MEGVANWDKLTWQEKREERFKRWLKPRNVKFVSPEAEKLYKERVMRFIKAIRLEEPDRVPVILPVGYYPAYNAGISFRTLMYDVDAMRRPVDRTAGRTGTSAEHCRRANPHLHS